MSAPTTRVRVLHQRTAHGWHSVAPDLKNFQRNAETLERVQQLSEDGVRWALNTDKVEVQHEVRESPVHQPQENEVGGACDTQMDGTRETTDQHRQAKGPGDQN